MLATSSCRKSGKCGLEVAVQVDFLKFECKEALKCRWLLLNILQVTKFVASSVTMLLYKKNKCTVYYDKNCN